MALALQTRCGTCPPCGGVDCPSNVPDVRSNIGLVTIATHGFPKFGPATTYRNRGGFVPDRFSSGFHARYGSGAPNLHYPVVTNTNYYSTQYPKFCQGDVAEIGIWSPVSGWTPGPQFTCKVDYTNASPLVSPALDTDHWEAGAEGQVPRHFWGESSGTEYPWANWILLDFQRGDVAGGYVCTVAGSYRAAEGLPTWSNLGDYHGYVPVADPQPVSIEGTFIYASPERLRSLRETTLVSVISTTPNVATTQAGRWVESWSIAVKRRRAVRTTEEDVPLLIYLAPTLPNFNNPALSDVLVEDLTANWADAAIRGTFVGPVNYLEWVVEGSTQIYYTSNTEAVALGVYRTPDGYNYTVRANLKVERYMTTFDTIENAEWGQAGIELLDLLDYTNFAAKVNGSRAQWSALGEPLITLVPNAVGQWSIESQVGSGSVLPYETTYTLRREVNRKTITGWQHRWLDTPGFPTNCSAYAPKQGYLRRQTTEQVLWQIQSREGAPTATILHEHKGQQEVTLAPTLWTQQTLKDGQVTIAPVGAYRCCPV